MADLVLVTLIIAFTALCVAYISWCDRIIGPDDAVAPTAVNDASAPIEPERVTA